jgi:hypothetical protein
MGFSIFEDDHPCPNNLFHIAIMHKANDSKPMSKPEGISTIYNCIEISDE